MLDDYRELQADSMELKKGIVELTKLVGILTERYKDIPTEKIEPILIKLQSKADTLIGIEKKYIDSNGSINTELLDENEENTSYLLTITYEYGNLAEELKDIIIQDVLPLAREVGDNQITVGLENLLSL